MRRDRRRMISAVRGTGGEQVFIFDYLFVIPGSALFLGMLQTREDQDTLEKVDQGNETLYVWLGFKLLIHTEQNNVFFYIHNTHQFESEC